MGLVGTGEPFQRGHIQYAVHVWRQFSRGGVWLSEQGIQKLNRRVQGSKKLKMYV